MRFLSITILFLFVNSEVWAQNVHTQSNRALKLYTDAVREYDFLNYPRAESLFKAAISVDERFYEAHLMLGDLFSSQKRYNEAIINYRKAVKIDSLFYRPVFFNLASAELKVGDYKNALIHFNVYLAQKDISEKNRKTAELNVINCEFAIKAISEPVPFNPVSAGDGINTVDDEYWPSITADGSTLIFTRQQSNRDNLSQTMLQEDFYISSYTNNIWENALNAGYPLNTRQNEGAQSLSSDGRYMYFTACDRPNGMGSCDLYFSYITDGKWSDPANLRSPVNSKSWESQPSISADGQTLFFSSNRAGGFGGKDLWMSRLNENKTWGVPVNLGNLINTEGDEMSPFIHFDGKTLYFSSDGKKGMGGFDIYRTILKDDSLWSEPTNLGYPINTFNDETGLVISSDGARAYFSSVREIKNGKDIFFFELYESARPTPVSYFKGKVYDSETGKQITADYELINLTDDNVSLKNTTDKSGNFLVCIPTGFNYGLNVSKTGYLFYSESFLLEGEHSITEPFVKNVNLSPIKVGEKMQLSNIFYEIDSWELKKESLNELNNLVRLLETNKGIIIEVGGYTDNTGSDEYNISLSEKRALSVVDYLIEKGIAASRLKHKGYGNADPLGDNVTIEGRSLNRRTEVKVLDQKKSD